MSQDRLQAVAEAGAEVAHRDRLSAKARADGIRERQLNETPRDLVVETAELVQVQQRHVHFRSRNHHHPPKIASGNLGGRALQIGDHLRVEQQDVVAGRNGGKDLRRTVARQQSELRRRVDEVARRAHDAMLGEGTSWRVPAPRVDRVFADVLSAKMVAAGLHLGKEPVANKSSERLFRGADPEPPAVPPVVQLHAVSGEDDQRAKSVEISESCRRRQANLLRP